VSSECGGPKPRLGGNSRGCSSTLDQSDTLSSIPTYTSLFASRLLPLACCSSYIPHAHDYEWSQPWRVGVFQVKTGLFLPNTQRVIYDVKAARWDIEIIANQSIASDDLQEDDEEESTLTRHDSPDSYPG